MFYTHQQRLDRAHESEAKKEYNQIKRMALAYYYTLQKLVPLMPTMHLLCLHVCFPYFLQALQTL